MQNLSTMVDVYQIRKLLFSLLGSLVMSIQLLTGQVSVDIEGPLQLGQVDTVTNTDHLVVRKSDGVLAVTPATQLNQVETPQSLPYASAWKHYYSGYHEGSFYKHQSRVYLDGTVRKRGVGGAVDTIFFDRDTLCYLPPDYRPEKRMIVYGKYNSDNVRLNIEPDGVVWFVYGAFNINWINLDGISFYRRDIQNLQADGLDSIDDNLKSVDPPGH